MNFLDPIIRTLPKLPSIIWTAAFGYVIIYVMRLFFKHSLGVFKISAAARQVMEGIIAVLLWVVFFVALLQSAGLGHLAIALSGSVAIIGIAVGTGANSLVADVIAGLYLAGDKDFGVGYRVKMGDVTGTVKKLDIRKVRIEDDKGNVYIMPNSEFDKKGWMVIEK